MQRIIDLTHAEDDAEHVPLLVDMNPQIPSRIKAIMDGGDNPGPTLAQMAKALETSGALALTMPCNTAHFYKEHIEAAVNIPFLDMLALSAKAITAQIGTGKVGMLASPLTDDVGIFANAFAPFDLEVIFPEDADHVLSIIRAIKADGVTPEMGGALSTLGHELKDRGAECLLVGCSEFSMLTSQLETNLLPVFDTVDVLAAEAIRFSSAHLRE